MCTICGRMMLGIKEEVLSCSTANTVSARMLIPLNRTMYLEDVLCELCMLELVTNSSYEDEIIYCQDGRYDEWSTEL